MSSQDFMATRRKFLKRSALGAGGVLFLPMLLESCTDHDIPPIDPPILTDPPILFDPQIDWNDDAKIMVTSAIEMIPEAGDLLGGLVDIFWPSTQEDVWGQVKDQVEALVNLQIAANVYQQVSEDLQGLNNVLKTYLNYLNPINSDGTPAPKDFEAIRTQWQITESAFDEALPHFQSKDNELALLGLFAQFVNLYLGLLRDGIAFAQSWGMTDGDRQQIITKLGTKIPEFIAYTTGLHQQHQEYLLGTKPNNVQCEPFRTKNTYNRQITLTVLDFMDLWPYFDPIAYPTGAKTLLTREINSDPIGTCGDSGDIVLAMPSPTQFPTGLVVWSSDRIDAVQVTYPAGSGPGGITQTPRMGNQGGGGGTVIVPIPGIPITAARASVSDWYNGNPNPGRSVDDLLAQLQFGFADGGTTEILGTNDADADQVAYWTDWLQFPNRALSRVFINGINKLTGKADCVVFGFAPWTDPKMTLRAVKTLYVTSPKERSMADLAKAHPKVAIPADLITDELKAARKKYWEWLNKK